MIGRRAVLLRLALRNVRRNARRSLLTATAMMLGLAMLVFSRAIADGAHEDWITNGVRLGTGHVVLERPAYRRSGDLADRLDSARLAVAMAALRQPDIAASTIVAAPRITVTGIANAAGTAVPVRIVAVDPGPDARFSLVDGKLTAGLPLTDSVPTGALVGVRLAHRLGLDPGSRFVVTAQGAHGEIADQLLRARGIFTTGVPDVDEGMIEMPLATARAWLGTGPGATEVAVLLRSSRDVAPIVASLRTALRGDSAIDVVDWQHALPALAASVRLDDYGDYVMHGILFVIVALAIVNTMLISVLHRSREFGVLRSLGLTGAQTGTLVMLEGGLLTALSGFAGLALGAGVIWAFFRHGLDFSFLMGNMNMSGVVISPVIIPDLRLASLLQSAAFIVVIGAVASLYPAVRAMRIDVARAMKFDE